MLDVLARQVTSVARRRTRLMQVPVLGARGGKGGEELETFIFVYRFSEYDIYV